MPELLRLLRYRCANDSPWAGLLGSAGHAGLRERQAKKGVPIGPEVGRGKRVHAPTDRDRLAEGNCADDQEI